MATNKPAAVQHLTYGFNQPLNPKVLPTHLQAITFGREYNQVILKDVLPEELQHLIFGDLYNQSLPIKGLPSTLKTIQFGEGFDRSLEDVDWPEGFESLICQNHLIPNALNV